MNIRPPLFWSTWCQAGGQDLATREGLAHRRDYSDSRASEQKWQKRLGQCPLLSLELSRMLENSGPLEGFFNPHPPEWQKSESWHYNSFEFIKRIHIAYITTEFNTKNPKIELSLIISNEFISPIHIYEIRFIYMNSDFKLKLWIDISELVYILSHIWIQNLYIWIHIHKFILYTWIYILKN